MSDESLSASEERLATGEARLGGLLDPERIVLPLVPNADVAAGQRVVPIHVVTKADFEKLKSRLEARDLGYLDDRGFLAESGQSARLPGEDGRTSIVLLGVGDNASGNEGELQAGYLSRRLRPGHYRFEALPRGWDMGRAVIGWCLGAYQYGPYLEDAREAPTLVLPADGYRGEGAGSEAVTVARGTWFGRALIDTPAGEMGPEALEKAARRLAKAYGAEVRSVVGRELLERNYPMIHAVGRAAHEAPRLVEFEWGDPSHPRVAVVGKGITFDTGGVNIKGASSARLMKKDMGGAAHALALAMMIMEAELPVRLHCLVPIAENAVSAGAYRPGDVLRSRAGLTVEIDNTDAEGRLVLGDALAKAVEDEPRLIIDFATLTGAARVALGPHLAPFYCNREGVVDAFLEAGAREQDPVWHMPLWRPYLSYLSSPIADMKNAGGRFAGSVTAALFLERFVSGRPWMHFDTYGWNPDNRPASPKGAELYGVRAAFAWLKAGGLNSRFDPPTSAT